MQDEADLSDTHLRRLAFIREEMRFEAGVLNDRINALISGEAFLMISFTMALVNSDAAWSAKLLVPLPPILSVLGFLLAVLAWPGVNGSFKILVEWNVLLTQALAEAPALSRVLWRPSLQDGGGRRTHIQHRNSMLFARAVPIVFAVAWALLTLVVLIPAHR